MLHERMIGVARRKERLLARCDAQRAALVQACRRWEEPARLIDRGWSCALYLRAHPLVVAAAAAGAVVLGRRNLFRWVGRAVVMWRTWRSLSSWLSRYNA